MTLKISFKKIKNFILKRYGDNLAAILIFGSVNTGSFMEGESDIDHFILLKKQNKLDFNKEIKFLIDSLRAENFATQYFYTLEDIKKRIKKKGSWSTYITIVSNGGSKILYSTPEFDKLKKELLKNPPSNEDIKKYLQKKDEIELGGYFKDTKDFALTKALFSHLRRKIQLLNYFQNKKIIFDYDKCLNNINLSDNEKRGLRRLYGSYKNRKGLSKKEVKDYYRLAKGFTKKLLKS